MSDVLSASPSKLKGNVSERLASHLMKSLTDGDKLEVKTTCRGQPIVFRRTTATRTPSHQASSETVRRRSAELSAHQLDLSGGTAQSARHQEVAGLKRLTKEEQEELLQGAGLKSSSNEAGSLLAIKADLSLPWNKLRKLKTWLKSFGVELESERTVHNFIASSIPPYTSKKVPMTKRNGEITMAAFVFFPNLIDIVIHYLDMYDESGKLHGHDGAIPSEEVWIKLGGDRGGGSFKFVMEVANAEHPNSVKNTVPVCVFDSQDTTSNLHLALGHYAEQVKELQTMKWRGKSIVVFIFGDYEFQTKLYGLSGASGQHPCLHCLCSKKSMQVALSHRPVGDTTERSLQAMTVDLNNFVAAGGNVKQALQGLCFLQKAVFEVLQAFWRRHQPAGSRHRPISEAVQI